MGKILITGALGNVGGYVAKYCIEKKVPVLLADIDSVKLSEKFGQHIEVVKFDFTDPTTYENSLKGVDRVFIMRPPHLGKPEDLKPFIDALTKHKDIVLISFLSLIGIENNPIPPHYRIEKMIEKTGIPYCHIRPSFYMQNISGIHAFEIKHFSRIVVPVKKALTSFIDAEDIGRLVSKVLSDPIAHQNKAYSITGPRAINYFEVADVLTKELKRKIEYANPSPSLAKSYWIDVRGIDRTYATIMGMLYMMTRFNTAKKVTSTYRDIMNEDPTDLSEFVRKNRNAWLND